MIALGAIAISYFFNYTDWFYIVIATMFFSSCVYWWFWSTWSIYKMSKLLKEAETKLRIVTATIKDIKKDLISILKKENLKNVSEAVGINA